MRSLPREQTLIFPVGSIFPNATRFAASWRQLGDEEPRGGVSLSFDQPLHWRFSTDGAAEQSPRLQARLSFNTASALRSAALAGGGFTMLPDYLVEENGGLVQLFGEADTLALDAFFVYPEELKSVARIQVFRDFLVANAQRWHF